MRMGPKNRSCSGQPRQLLETCSDDWVAYRLLVTEAADQGPGSIHMASLRLGAADGHAQCVAPPQVCVHQERLSACVHSLQQHCIVLIAAPLQHSHHLSSVRTSERVGRLLQLQSRGNLPSLDTLDHSTTSLCLRSTSYANPAPKNCICIYTTRPHTCHALTNPCTPHGKMGGVWCICRCIFGAPGFNIQLGLRLVNHASACIYFGCAVCLSQQD